jgi:TolB-like protein/Tfp pilus assembly protein PilF
MSAVWEDVKGRKIFKAATFYAAITWGIIQIADILLPVLRYDEQVMSLMVIIAFAGFPVALITGWMLDIRNERAKLVENPDGSLVSKSIGSRLIELSIIIAFGSGAGLLYFNNASQAENVARAALPTVQQLTNNLEDEKSIAVLPFASFGSLPEDDYFADGLSEELLNVLASNKRLRVVARTSSFQYKNQNINIKKIARELGVQYILEGSVRRSGEQIRVTAQLIKADEDVHVFSSTWDKDTTNIFKVQDEIAESVLETLEIELLGKVEETVSHIGTEDIAAFAEYSRGVAFVRNRSKDDFEDAIVHFKNALAIDSQYAEANAMLAETYLLQLSYGLIKKEQAFELAEPLIELALTINPELAEGHAVKGLLSWQMADNYREEPDMQAATLDTAKYHLVKAIELNPSNAEAYMWYATILQNEGSLADGSELYKKAFEIDPHAAVVGYNRGQDLIRTGHYKEAMSVFNVVVRNNPNYANAYSIAGEVSYAVGQLDQAFSMYKKMADLSGIEEDWLMRSANIDIPLGRFEKAQLSLDQLKKTESEKMQRMLPQLQAKLWIASNQVKKLGEWAETLNENSDSWEDRLWIGIAALSQAEWKHAAEDLSVALELLKSTNRHRQDEMTVRIQLMLATAWQELGDSLKSESYLDSAAADLASLQSQQVINPQSIRYHQAVSAALSNEPLVALGLLRQAIQEGFVDVWMIEFDPAFNKLRDDPTYLAIIREFDSKSRLMKLNIEAQEQRLALGQ